VRRKIGWLATAAALTVFFVAGSVWPASSLVSRVPLCPFPRAFGVGCPGCGMTRSVTAFLAGDFAGSIRMHLFGPVIVAIAAYFWIRAVAALLAARPRPIDLEGRRWIVGLSIFLTLYLGYWVFRLATHTTPV
jgi:hypothetical protein